MFSKEQLAAARSLSIQIEACNGNWDPILSPLETQTIYNALQFVIDTEIEDQGTEELEADEPRVGSSKWWRQVSEEL